MTCEGVLFTINNAPPKIPPKARNAMISNLKSCHRGLNQSIASDKRPCNNCVHITSRLCKHVQRNFCWSCLDDSQRWMFFGSPPPGQPSQSLFPIYFHRAELLFVFFSSGVLFLLAPAIFKLQRVSQPSLAFSRAYCSLQHGGTLLSFFTSSKPTNAECLLPPFVSWTKESPIYNGIF